MPDLDLQIMLAGFRPDLDLLDLKGTLFFFGLLLPLGQFILITAIVHDLAYRRLRIWRHLHQIQTKIGSYRQRLGNRYNSELVSLRIDNSHLSSADHPVNIRLVVFLRYSYTCTSSIHHRS